MAARLFTFAVLVFAPLTSLAGAEWVSVAKVDGDNAIVMRRDGSAHLIEVGTGCISLWRQEGKRALITSPGTFLGIGSKLVLPEQDQSCRIWNSEDLGTPNPATSTSSSECEDGHWIQSVMSDGKIIKLDDGSVWEVDPVDAIDSMLWLPVARVMVCGDAIINTDEGEKVSATRIR